MTNKKILRAPILYGAFSAFVFLFGAVYTYFGHGVTSDNMTYAFVPLLIAALLYLLLAWIPKIPRPERFSATFLAFTATCFTLHNISQGIMQIAGAYSDYDVIIPTAGIVCLAIAVILYPTEIFLLKKQQIKQ